MVRLRSVRGAAAAAAALAATMTWPPGWAIADSHCGARYTVRPGDTLASIAERCGTSVEALAEANAQIADPARISVGWELTIPGAAASLGPEDEVRAPERSDDAEAVLAAGTYEVRPGDSFASIATALQVSLRELMAANEGIDPFALKPGQMIRLPEGAGEAAAAAAEQPGGHAGLRDADEGEPEGQTAIGPDGRADGAPTASDGAAGQAAETQAASEPAQGETDQEATARSSPGEAERHQVGTGAAEADGADTGRVTLRGRVQNGTECLLLRTQDGELYSLVSAEYGLLPGEYVEIEGEPVEMSLCMEGQATLRVTSMTTMPAPKGS